MPISCEGTNGTKENLSTVKSSELAALLMVGITGKVWGVGEAWLLQLAVVLVEEEAHPVVTEIRGKIRQQQSTILFCT